MSATRFRLTGYDQKWFVMSATRFRLTGYYIDFVLDEIDRLEKNF